MDEAPKKYSLSTIIVTTLAIIIILALAVLLYYYSIKPVPAAPQESVSTVKNNTKATPEQPPAPQIVPTNIITFTSPEVLPKNQVSGSCWTGSIAAGERKDAFRCIVGNAISDPCFEMKQKGFVFCQMNPTSDQVFAIRLTKPLPAITLPETIADNWAWFLTLSDGTICSPFTGTIPLVNGQPENYGCKSENKNQRIGLVGDLTTGQVWTAQEVVLEQQGTAWVQKSSQQVNIDTIWQ